MFAVPDVSRYSVHKALLIISPVLLAAVQYITLAKLLMLAPAASTTSSSRRDDRACSSSADGRSPSNEEGAADGGGEVGRDAAIATAGSSGGSSSSITSPSSGHPILSMAVLVGFTAGQVICLVLQTSGGALYSNPAASALYGRLLLLSGFGLQLVFDSAFILVAAIVQRSRYFGFRGYQPLRPVFTCMYATTLLMHWRNIFRIAEFSQGHEGDVAWHEAYLFVLDFMPLYACFLLYTFMHYGFWLGPQSEVMLARQVASPLDLTDKQQQQQLPAPEADILHVHCS